MPKNTSSLSHKIRQILDAPWKQKGFLFWLLFPALWLIAKVIGIESKRRRRIHSRNTTPLPVVCVGNVLMGGTGKTPVVQALVQFYLTQGYCVGIASRGIGADPILVSPFSSLADVLLLSDENREHYFSLHSKKDWIILQNKDRLKSLEDFAKHAQSQPKPPILILDDGLQHFKCPRTWDICLWDPDLLEMAPPYCFPLGPYREGFGPQDMGRLLQIFDVRLWSRCRHDQLKQWKEKVQKACNNYGISLGKKDVFISYGLSFWTIKDKEKKSLTKEDVLCFSTKALLLCGIAHPIKIKKDIEETLSLKQELPYFALKDHGNLTSQALEMIKSYDILFLSCKDYFRWFQDTNFIIHTKFKTLVICQLDIEFHHENEEFPPHFFPAYGTLF